MILKFIAEIDTEKGEAKQTSLADGKEVELPFLLIAGKSDKPITTFPQTFTPEMALGYHGALTQLSVMLTQLAVGEWKKSSGEVNDGQ